MTQRYEIVVKFQKRDDGGLRVWSEDVPLFALSGDDPKAVAANIIPVLEVMVAQMLSASTVKIEMLEPFSNREQKDRIEPFKLPKGDLSYCVAA